MTYSLKYARPALSYLQRLDARTQSRVLQRIEEICGDPHGRHSKPLVGRGKRRASRVGALRLIFVVDDLEESVHVVALGTRGQVYRDL